MSEKTDDITFQPKRKPGRPPRVVVRERADQQSLDTLLSDPRYKSRLSDPFGAPSEPIQLKDSSRECHWFNAAIQNDHIWQKKKGGWDQVRPEDIRDIEQVGGFNVSPEGYVTRGERGQELLMSMPKVVVRAIAMKKAELNKRMGRPSVQRQASIEALGRTDDMGAEFLQQAAKRFDIQDSYETIQVTPEE
jgi:hypothetical protein